MATCLISLVEEIGKRIQNQFVDQFVSPLVEPHFNYWWCFDTNIQSLRGEVGHLDQKIRYLKQKIEEAGHVTENLRARVGEWLDLTSEKLAEGRRILQDDNIPRAWNITSRYSIGKRAKKTAGEIANLRKVGNFNMSPPMEFESRKSIEKNIVDCLNKSTVGMIVICGMGGVGKTTMAKTIMERVKEENLFNEVVMVTVSQTMDKPKIQNEIAELLDLKFDVETIPARANELRTRLMDTKRKIIILDDVWDSFKSSEDFELLGIPVESEMCKVLLTSRDANACKGIRSKEVFAMKILEADEAWLLFKDKAGDCVEGVNDVAREVAAECKGLPLALVTVGLALQNITDIYTWNNALSQLRKAYPEDFSEVYNWRFVTKTKPRSRINKEYTVAEPALQEDRKTVGLIQDLDGAESLIDPNGLYEEVLLEHMVEHSDDDDENDVDVDDDESENDVDDEDSDSDDGDENENDMDDDENDVDADDDESENDVDDEDSD